MFAGALQRILRFHIGRRRGSFPLPLDLSVPDNLSERPVAPGRNSGQEKTPRACGVEGRLMTLAETIRTIPDYPKPGIMFRDITTLLGDARAFRRAVDELVQPFAGAKIDMVAGVEARGFILGGAVAHQLSAGFAPVRKKGKLPAETLRQTYALEYGQDEVEIHVDAFQPGQSVLLVDDLIATGGTAEAAITLIRRAGACVAGAVFLVDLPDLGGAARIQAMGAPVKSLISFPGH